MRKIHCTEVYGISVDAQTRCAHYNSDLDIIAIKFRCCERWYPCFDCHAETNDHQPAVWKIDERYMPAVLCGGCGHQMSVTEYLGCNSICPNCRRQFNPGCARHHHLYFEAPLAVE